MNFKKKLHLFFLFLFIIMPINVLAYSDYIIAGGENIGIEVESNGIIVAGFYKVGNNDIAKDAGFILGDRIIKIENESTLTIDDMVKKIDKLKDKEINITVLRDNNEIDLKLNLVKDSNGIYKTGLYVKDQITGVGTLTYIDPYSKIFGALGHEIIESNSNTKMDIKDGKIFKSDVIGIIKSTDKTTGEKRARFDSSISYGKIKENTTSGIFGRYSAEISNENTIKVGNPNEIEIGKATIRTVLEKDKVEEYSINILKINNDSSTKNILFEIADERLVEKSNGIIKGMSGSPIIQNNKIIGAVTHAIVNDNNKGYGIFITTMLEEGEN